MWKWILRGVGVAAFVYVLVVMDGEVALGAYIIIGGLIGLPNVLGWQQALNSPPPPVAQPEPEA